MIVLGTALGVLAGDVCVKLALRRYMPAPVRLGRWATVRISSHPIWVIQARPHVSPLGGLLLLSAAIVPLVVVSTIVPNASPFLGLAVGGAFSNWFEQSVRGSVTDYVELHFWPAFNLADAAIVCGVLGLGLAAWNAVA